MKICYLILAHKNPEQLRRLVSALDDTGVNFFIHVNKRSQSFYNDAREVLANFANVNFLPRKKIWWGTFGIIDAVITGIEAIANSDISCDRVVLISGQDYPIKSKEYIKAFFEKNSDKNYIEFFPFSVKNKWTNMGGWYSIDSRLNRTLISFRGKALMLPLKRKAPFGYVAYGGSFWWNLNRDCIRYMAAFLKERPEFTRFARYLFLPDEMFFNTILANSPLRHTLVSSNLRYIDWEKHNPVPPAILMMEDFEALQDSPALFARKFDMHRDSEIFDKIDNELLLNPEARVNASVPMLRSPLDCPQSGQSTVSLSNRNVRNTSPDS